MKKKLKKAQLGLRQQAEADTKQRAYLDRLAEDKMKSMSAAPQQQDQTPTYGRESFWDSPVTLNWSHILGSQVAQGILSGMSNASPNSYQNATLRYNQEKNPIDWLPQNPNTGLQSFYGMQMGGLIDDYIRNFVFEEDTPIKEEKQTKKKKDSKEQVSESDLEQLVQEGEDTVRKRIGSMNRIKSMGANYEDIDPSVQSATAELLAKFPNLTLTSSKRSWGDKDAHPIGRAIDVAGDPQTMQEAWKYYSDTLVPKYQFNPALPLKHSSVKDGKRFTANPHIHLGYYQQGGTSTRPTTRDSIDLYVNTLALDKYYKKAGYNVSTESLAPGEGHDRNEYAYKKYNDANYRMSDNTSRYTNNGSNQNVPISQYRQNIDKNKYKQREAFNNVLDLRAPMGLYDKRIDPVFTNVYEAPENIKPESLSEDKAGVYMYDPIQVKPWVLLTPEEKKIRIKKYGYPSQEDSDHSPNNVVIFKDGKELIRLKDGTLKQIGTYKRPPVEPIEKIKFDPRFKAHVPIAANQVDLSNLTPNIQGRALAMNNTPTKYSYTYPTFDERVQNTLYAPDAKSWRESLKRRNVTSSQEGANYGTATGHYQTGGIVNTTGYTEGSTTKNNPMNVIPGGDITMANVYKNVMALPMKNNKLATKPIVMQPGLDYAFDADYTMEFKIGGTYEVDEQEVERLKKLGYAVEIV